MRNIANLNSNRKSKHSWIKWIARVFSSFIYIVISLFFLGKLILQHEEGVSPILSGETFYIFCGLLLLMLSVIGGWINEKWGGVSLLSIYLILATAGYFIAGSNSFVPALTFSPFLFCGILYLVYWYTNRKSIRYTDN